MISAKEQEFPYSCYSCNVPCKRGDPSIIRAIGRIYHRQCFNCSVCQLSVLTKFYVLEMNTIVCQDHYSQQQEDEEEYQFKCQQCQGNIIDDYFSVIGDCRYHTTCLFCPGCTISTHLMSSNSVPTENYHGRPYCRYHYSLIKGTACIGCGQAIFSDQSNKGKWHTECYMIKKYWHVDLTDLQSMFPTDYTSKEQLESIQKDTEAIRCKIWKDLSQFEDESSRLISNIVVLNQSDDHLQEYKACNALLIQFRVLLTALEVLFAHVTCLSCDLTVQELCDYFTAFLQVLCQSDTLDEMEKMIKIATKLSQTIRHLVRLGLQQAVILERNFRLEKSMIHQMLFVFVNQQHLDHFELFNGPICLMEIAMERLAFMLNIEPYCYDQGKRPDETQLYKVPSTPQPPPLSRPNNIMLGMPYSTSNIPQISKSDIPPPNIQRSKSASKTTFEERNSTSRMETFKRALTTSRKKSTRPKRSSTSLSNPPPLYISLPDVEQLNQYHATPPSSPPSANQQIWTIPVHLPELTGQQDCIIRHIAVLYAESHVDDYLLLDDLLSLLDTKKPSTTSSSSLWGKLKTHILTPTSDSPPTTTLSPSTSERKIGVSLSNFSSGSIHQNHSVCFEEWKAECPVIASCFSPQSLVPNFLKDCILAMIDQDINMEGIFRKSGNIRGLRDMCETLDTQPMRQDWTSYFKSQTIVQLAAFIKRFLRELPEPLLTYRLHKLFILSNKATTLLQALNIMHFAVCILPKPNRDILLLILALLNWVAKHSDTNKMDYENLARVMAPNILYSSSEATNNKKQAYNLMDISACHSEIWVISIMIQHYERFFKVPDDFSTLLEHPRMSEYLCTNSIDLTSSKHFIRAFSSLLKIKKSVMQTNLGNILPPSPSSSAKYS